MAVAEILAGIALVKKSAEIISKGLNAAQDMSSLASQVDDLFEGKKQLKHQERQERAVGKSPTQTIIDQKLADEHILEIKSLIIARFGFYAWTDIIKLQKEAAHEQKQRQALERKAQQQKQEDMQEAAVVGGSLAVGIALVFLIGFTVWAMQ